MSHTIIRQLFERRLSDWATARKPPLRIDSEGVVFEPEDDETYVKAFAIPASTGSNTLGGDHRVYTGVFQVSIVTPSGSGPGMAEDLVDEIAELYPLYLRLNRGDFEVIVLTPVEPSPGIPDNTTYTVAASFQYRADTN
ncbi:phage tail terminator-like protein [Pseudomonas sp. NPDC087697]|uniref:phage tail terminator-like protein n=1 Tax=Pseudomonas sp. NPDC087697 TaxID=3364447 RepID=UPI003822A6C1